MNSDEMVNELLTLKGLLGEAKAALYEENKKMLASQDKVAMRKRILEENSQSILAAEGKALGANEAERRAVLFTRTVNERRLLDEAEDEYKKAQRIQEEKRFQLDRLQTELDCWKVISGIVGR